MTVQECEAGKPLLEEVWKKFSSGEKIACRPLYGKTTQYYRWTACAKYWETNCQFPSIKGDASKLHELRSVTRRLRAVHLKSVFTSDASAVKVESAVFREDSDLMEFLEADTTRLAYIRFFLLPFIAEHSAHDCRQMLLNPPEEIINATRRVVAQMANGGLEAPSEYRTAEEESRLITEASNTVIRAHKDATNARQLTIKEYNIGRVCKSLPGTVHESTKKKKTRKDYLVEAVDLWPHLVERVQGTMEFKFLDLDYEAFASLLTRYGANHFGGGFDCWAPIWAAKRDFALISQVNPTHPEIREIAAEVHVMRTEEWVNVVRLEEDLESGAISSKQVMVRQLLDRYARHGKRSGDFAILTVEYVRKHGVPGRWYAKGPSIQLYLSKFARHSGFATSPADTPGAGRVFVDVDINNCFFTILCNLVTNELQDTTDIGTLLSFKTHYAEWRNFLAEYLRIPLKAAKKLLIRLVHLGRPQHDIPFLWNLATQIRQAVTVLLEMDRFQYLQSKFSDRPNPTATRLHYALASVEEEIMVDLGQSVTQHVPDCTINALMFDGAVLRMSESSIPELHRVLEAVGTRHSVTFSTSRFDRLGGAGGKVFQTTLKRCVECNCRLKAPYKPVQCTIVGSETVTAGKTLAKRCCSRYCGASHRPNFVWRGDTKINTASYEQIRKKGVYFVTNTLAFTHSALALARLRLLRARVAPGQEAWVRHLFLREEPGMAEVQLMGAVSLRDNLLHAIEAISLLRRSPAEVLNFDVNFPAQLRWDRNRVLTFAPRQAVTALAFDGHFGVHRVLDDGCDTPRPFRATGRRRYREDERTASCAHKDAQRRAAVGHTAGWQFVLDPVSHHLVSAKEHIHSENMDDKVQALRAAMRLPRVDPNLLIHDDACHFEAYVKRHCPTLFSNVKHYVIGKLHCRNHKCSKRVWTRAEKRRMGTLPSELAETFNAWIRSYNFFLNSLRPASHRFWVNELCHFWNAGEHKAIGHYTRRSNAGSRKTSGRVRRKRSHHYCKH